MYWVRDAFVIVIGAIIIYAVIDVGCKTYPDFCQHGWTLWVEYIAGAVLYLKDGPRRNQGNK